MATIQNMESRQAGPGGRAMAGAEAADCEVSVLTAIVGKVYLFSHAMLVLPFSGLINVTFAIISVSREQE